MQDLESGLIYTWSTDVKVFRPEIFQVSVEMRNSVEFGILSPKSCSSKFD